MEVKDVETKEVESQDVEKKTKKEKEEKKEGVMTRVMTFIKEEHKFENWILFAISIPLLVISIYILLAGIGNAMGDNESVNMFADTYFDVSVAGWGIFNQPWKVILISSIIVAIAAGSLIYSVWPVFVPSFKELKFVTWTDKKTLFANSLTVVCFIVFLTVLFYLFNLALAPLFNLMFGA
ncbi:preprotein translocase subunit SecE [bacterium]|nr:preprotein translocase subunit SecE [bacterium]